MARFVADGYLEFPEVVPTDLNAAVLRDIEGMPHRDLWRHSEAIRPAGAAWRDRKPRRPRADV
jgi:hypothetical protein